MPDKSIKVLLVENNEAHVELIRRAFEERADEFSLMVSNNLKEARQMLIEIEPDVAVVDLMLPDGRGIELLDNEINETSIPFMIMTSHGDEKVAVEAMKAGAMDYLVKSEIVFQDMPHAIGRTLREWNHILDRKRVERDLKYMASHDALTNLPNRNLFEDRLKHALNLAQRNSEQVVVLFIDIDDFKSVNDAFNHQEGDRVLQIISARLRSQLRVSDSVGRLGGDEFGAIIENVVGVEEISPIAQKILQAVSEPIMIQEREIFITASIGIALFPNNGSDASELVQNADTAMYRVKQDSKNNYKYYSDEMDLRSLEQLELINHLKHAVESHAMQIYYQPQVNIHTWEIVGLEALLRWNHPELGQISPGKFIPLAESTGMIIPMGEWVLRTVCKQINKWLKTGFPFVRVAINISARQLMDENLVEMLQKTTSEFDIDPSFLELELTESTFIKNIDEAKKILDSIKALGMRLAIDDFGTGYSSLSSLTQFPVDTLKIDHSFSQKAVSNYSDAMIMAGVIEISKSLGIDFILEGVETQEQYDFYKDFGCEKIQGYYISRAVPAKELESVFFKGGKAASSRP